jgi:hypothetical protein
VYNDCLSIFVCLNTCEGCFEMNSLSLSMPFNEGEVVVEFDWYGASEDSEPDWETMEVWALLTTQVPAEKRWVKINDLIHEQDWLKIEKEIYQREDELRQQAYENQF